jgi:hypothetical protein
LGDLSLNGIKVAKKILTYIASVKDRMSAAMNVSLCECFLSKIERSFEIGLTISQI